jgi:hypothetical protein
VKIKDLAKKWPPVADALSDPAVKPALDDVVFSARKFEGDEDHISLKLFKADGTEYMATLELPETAVAKALILLVAEKNLTLREVGELDLS